MKKILVAGATGYLGRYMVKILKEQGYWIRALVRNPSSLDHPGGHGSPSIRPYIDEVFQGNITDSDTLGGSCEGVDAVFSSVGITRQKEGFTYWDVDYKGNRNLLNEALKSGVSRFMYIAVFRGNEMSGMLNSAKEKFVQELKASSLPYIIIRPTGYFSDMEEFLQMAGKGRVMLIGNGEKRMNPIHGADLAQYCALRWNDLNVEWNVGGPEVLTHRQIAHLAFQAVGKKEKLTFIPTWLFKTGITPLKWFSPKNYGPVEFLFNALSHDLVAPAFGHHDLLTHFEQQG